MKNDKKQIWSWAMYDWANSAFYTTVIAGFFPVFFKKYWSGEAALNESTFHLGLANSIGSVIIAILSPMLGAIADRGGIKRRFLIFFTLLGSIMTIALSMVNQGQWQLALMFFILGNISIGSSISFNDSQLVDIVTEDKYHSVSALGYSLGYLGGGLLFAVNILMTVKPELFGFKDATEGVKASFASVGLWWTLFSLPLFIYVRDTVEKPKESYKELFIGGFNQLIDTVKEIKSNKVLLTFLLAYWLYIDGVHTVIRMAVDYGMALGFDSTILMTALLITQFVGFPAAIGFGYIANKFGPKTGIYISLVVYTCVTISGYFMNSSNDFYILAITIGLVQGGVQSLSRSIFSQIIPASKSTEYFGFFNMVGKFSTILGPLLMGYVAYISDNRTSLLSLIVFFILGGFLLYKTDLDEGMRQAKKI